MSDSDMLAALGWMLAYCLIFVMIYSYDIANR